MTNKTTSELLAPAGTPDAAWAAFAYGADAIYAGLPRFSARAEADNFTPEALDELIGFAHTQNRKVYITLNTLVQQAELPDALEALEQIVHLNADGVIVQDMGLARIVKTHFPSLDLHASTQLVAHNLEGAKVLADAGFSRVVLARELSFKEIEQITAACGIETEVFVHGALCYSYSGLCLFSSHLISRSGNRGRCAYCCRQTFNQNQLPFAMRDLSLAEYIPQLLNAGVHSLKIEGRMKSPIYVAAVTDLYRKLIKKELSPAQLPKALADLQTIFGRPSTDLYFNSPNTNPVDPTTNGHRGARIGTISSIRKDKSGSWLHFHTNRAIRKYDGLKIELPDAKEPYGFPAHELKLTADPKQRLCFDLPADKEVAVRLPDDHPYLAPDSPIYCSISQEVRERYSFEAPRPGTMRQRTPVDITLSLAPDKLEIQSGTTTRTLPGPFEAAKQPERTAEAIQKAFSKTGDTEWALGNLTLNDPTGLFVPASLLNEARRQFFEALTQARATARQLDHFARLESLVDLPETDLSDSIQEDLPPVKWSIKLRNPTLLAEFSDEELSLLDEVILEVADQADFAQAAEAFNGRPLQRLRFAAPIIQRKKIQPGARQPFEASNIGALYNPQAPSITADWPLYTLNTEAAKQWQQLGIERMVLSPEDTSDNMKALCSQLGDRAIVPLFQYTPLMISATRPDGPDALSDRQNKSYQIEHYNDCWVLYSESPFSLVDHIDELREAGATRFRIDLSYGISSPLRAAELFRKIIKRLYIPNAHDGNWNKTL